MPKREDLLFDSEFFSKNQSNFLDCVCVMFWYYVMCIIFVISLYVQTIGRRIMFEWVIISWNPAKVVSFFLQAFLTRSEQKEGLFLCSSSFCFEPFLHFLWQWNWIKRRRKQNQKYNEIAFTLQEWRGNLLNGSCIPWMLRWLRNFL